MLVDSYPSDPHTEKGRCGHTSPRFSAQVKVAIHQPDFFPWLGFFFKLSQADVFVCLTHCVVDVKNCRYLKRVQMMVDGEAEWFTVPLCRTEGTFVPISELRIERESKLLKKQQRWIEQNYRSAPYFNEFLPLVEAFYQHESDLLALRNAELLQKILRGLEFKLAWRDSADLEVTEYKNNMNAQIVQLVGGHTYVSGGGATYQSPEPFDERGLRLEITRFHAHPYPQVGTKEFRPGLSVLDALMNCGWERTRELILGTRTSPIVGCSSLPGGVCGANFRDHSELGEGKVKEPRASSGGLDRSVDPAG
ncbi:MAG: hypothetical protein AMXMBFR33_46090 [Candidatus Xenobia bacterium]